MSQRRFRQGDRVVFTRMKHDTQPVPRARRVRPTANGEDYVYTIEKFWVVADVLGDGQLVLQTPRGKKRRVDIDDPSLRHANWIERLRYRERFIRSEAGGSPA